MCTLQCLSVVIPVIVNVAVEMLRPASPKVELGNYYHEMRKINEIYRASVLPYNKYYGQSKRYN